MVGRLLGAISFSNVKQKSKTLLFTLVVTIALLIISLVKGADIMGIFALLMFFNLIAFRLGRSLPGRTTGIFFVVYHRATHHRIFYAWTSGYVERYRGRIVCFYHVVRTSLRWPFVAWANTLVKDLLY